MHLPDAQGHTDGCARGTNTREIRKGMGGVVRKLPEVGGESPGWDHSDRQDHCPLIDCPAAGYRQEGTVRASSVLTAVILLACCHATVLGAFSASSTVIGPGSSASAARLACPGNEGGRSSTVRHTAMCSWLREYPP